MTESTLQALTIGIPTFNRHESLGRAVDSALAQSYPHVRILICDNASTDATEEYCLALAANHANVTYVRQPQNVGAVRNFLSCLSRADGEFFMWLADDDWIDEKYAEACIRQLQEDHDLLLVAGTALTSGPGESEVKLGTTLLEANGRSRLFRYYRGALQCNDVFYGVYRQTALRDISLPNRIGGDWHLVASVVFRGMVKTIEGVAIHRQAGGTSSSVSSMARACGLPGYRGVFPFFWIALDEAADVMRGEPPFEAIGYSDRLAIGFGVFANIFYRHVLINGSRRATYRLVNLLVGRPRYRRWREKLRTERRQNRVKPQ